MQHNQFFLLTQRRFLPLFVTQFLGAFNDNLFKSALMIMVTFQSTTLWGMTPEKVVTVTAGLFILPFFLFSATGGQLADKFCKHLVMRQVKLFEVCLMLLAALGFYLNNLSMLLIVLFGMGVQSALFGPLKYGILPEHLKEEELMAGNGLIETGTFLAILLGTITGGLLISYGGEAIYGVLIPVAFLGLAASWMVPETTPMAPKIHVHWNILRETWDVMNFSFHEPRVFKAIIAISWFWFIGATFLALFAPLAKEYMSGDEHVVTLLLAAFSIGIGAGSMWCNKLTKGQPVTTYVKYGALGMTVFTLAFCAVVPFINGVETGAVVGVWAFLSAPINLLALLMLVLIAVCGGVFIVPLYVVLQHDSAEGHKARTIASNNIWNAAFMVASALVTLWLLSLDFSILEIFVLMGLANIGMVLMMVWYK